jgi:uncharacterized BrkB/YihY/UPF0761 family membrane protein
VSPAALKLLFSMLFKGGPPDRQLAWRCVWSGGFAAALLFNLGKSWTAWYIGTGSNRFMVGCVHPRCC